MKRVLLAVGNEKFSQILRKYLNDHFEVLPKEVYQHKYLQEIIDETRPDIVIGHDYYLDSDKQTKEERELEWLDHIEYMRREYEDSIRFVFICEREKGDPFLSELVNRNVLDIVRHRVFDVPLLVDQLLEPPKYSRVADLRVNHYAYTQSQPIVKQESQNEDVKASIQSDNPKMSEYESQKVTDESKDQASKKESLPQPIIKKVIKKDVKKIKREIKLQINRQTTEVVGVSVPGKIIIFGSPFPRMGTTFITHLLAHVIAEQGVAVSYIENPYQQAYTYDRFVGQEKAPDFISLFYRHAKRDMGQSTAEDKNTEWIHEGVHWIVKNPLFEPNYTDTEVDIEVFTKIIFTLKHTPIILIDVGTDWYRDVYRYLYDVADYAFVVMDADISNIQYFIESKKKGHEYIRQILQDEKTEWVANRFTPKMLKNEAMKTFFGSDVLSIPAFHTEACFKAQYNGNTLLKSKDIGDQVRECLNPLLKKLLPEELLKRKHRKGFFHQLFHHSFSISKTDSI